MFKRNATTVVFHVDDKVDTWWRGKWWIGGRVVCVLDETLSVTFPDSLYGTKWATNQSYRLTHVRHASSDSDQGKI
jgi:hypothetical protein